MLSRFLGLRSGSSSINGAQAAARRAVRDGTLRACSRARGVARGAPPPPPLGASTLASTGAADSTAGAASSELSGQLKHTVVKGHVQSVTPIGVFVRLPACVRVAGGGAGCCCVALLHHDEVTGAADGLVNLEGHFKLGDEVRAVVLHVEEAAAGCAASPFIYLSTKVLERNPGDMLRNPRHVYDGASKAVARWLRRQKKAAAAREDEPQVGQLAEGDVTEVDAEKGMRVLVGGGVVAWIAPDEISFAADVPAAEKLQLLKTLDKVKAIVVGGSSREGLALSTAQLERFAGQMLTDPKAVYKRAHASAIIWSAHRQPVHVVLAATRDVTVGSVLEGQVVLASRRGLTLQTAEGFRAFIPRHEVDSGGDGGPTSSGVVQLGDTVRAVVKGVDTATRRLFLTTKLESSDRSAAGDADAELVGQVVRGKVVQVLRSGVEVSLQLPAAQAPTRSSGGSSSSSGSRGPTGFLPTTQISQERVSHPGAVFKLGQPVRALVTSLDVGRGLLLLSTKALEKSPGDMLRNPKGPSKVAEMEDVSEEEEA